MNCEIKHYGKWAEFQIDLGSHTIAWALNEIEEQGYKPVFITELPHNFNFITVQARLKKEN